MSEFLNIPYEISVWKDIEKTYENTFEFNNENYHYNLLEPVSIKDINYDGNYLSPVEEIIEEENVRGFHFEIDTNNIKDYVSVDGEEKSIGKYFQIGINFNELKLKDKINKDNNYAYGFLFKNVSFNHKLYKMNFNKFTINDENDYGIDAPFYTHTYTAEEAKEAFLNYFYQINPGVTNIIYKEGNSFFKGNDGPYPWQRTILRDSYELYITQNNLNEIKNSSSEQDLGVLAIYNPKESNINIDSIYPKIIEMHFPIYTNFADQWNKLCKAIIDNIDFEEVFSKNIVVGKENLPSVFCSDAKKIYARSYYDYGLGGTAITDFEYNPKDNIIKRYIPQITYNKFFSPSETEANINENYIKHSLLYNFNNQSTPWLIERELRCNFQFKDNSFGFALPNSYLGEYDDNIDNTKQFDLKITIPKDSVLKFDLYFYIREYVEANGSSTIKFNFSESSPKIELINFLNDFTYLDEQKIAVIGSNTMEGRNKAYSPKLTESITNVNTLTFSLYRQYWDDMAQDFVDNPFIDLLLNETKIKLNKNGEWYDFLIKNKTEDSEQHSVEYTCKDLHATTLGKQGFNIELSADLYNNQGTIEELCDTVLEYSDWEQDKTEKTGTEIIYEKKEETLYEINLYGKKHQISYNYYGSRDLFTYKNNKFEKAVILGNILEEITPGQNSDKYCAFQPIYVHYSDLIKEWHDGDYVPCYIPRLNNPDNIFASSNASFKLVDSYETDYNGVIDDWDNIYYFKYESSPEGSPDKFLNAEGDTKGTFSEDNINSAKVTTLRSKRRVDTNIQKYLPEFQKYVGVYYKKDKDGNYIIEDGNKKEYYCYTETEYITSDLASELIVNGGGENEEEGIISDDGWISNDYQYRPLSYGSYLNNINGDKLKEAINATNPNVIKANTRGYILLDKTKKERESSAMYVCNTGIIGNKSKIKNFTKGDKYILELQCNLSNTTNLDWLTAYGYGPLYKTKDPNKPYSYEDKDGLGLIDGSWLNKDSAWNVMPTDTGDKAGLNPTVSINFIEYTNYGYNSVPINIEDAPIAKAIKACRFSDSEESNTEDKSTSTGGLTNTTKIANIVYELEVLRDVPEDVLQNSNIGIQIYSRTKGNKNDIVKYNFRIYKASLFKEIEVSENRILAPDYTLRLHPKYWAGKEWGPSETYTLGRSEVPTTGTKIKYNIYDPSLTANQGVDNVNELTYKYQGYDTPESQLYEVATTNEKIRNIEASKSNTFNILQSLSEAFECWCKIRVEHEDDGRIKLANPPTHQKKYISYHNFIGDKNDVGFRYGTNVSDIQRNIDSDTFVTKLIVPDNITTYGEDGLCTISRAKDNIGKDNTIYNLDYYIQMGLLTEKARSDLSDYLTELGRFSKNYNTLTKTMVAATTEKTHATAAYQTWQNMVNEGEKQLIQLKNDFSATYNISFDKVINYKDKKDPTQKWPELLRDPDNNNNLLEEPKTDLINILTLQSVLGTKKSSSADATGYYFRLYVAQKALNKAILDYRTVSFNLEIINNNRKALYRDFSQKYGIYLQEGTWSSSNYLDDNLYYLDANQTLALSAKPQISYSISAINIQGLDGYESYKYRIGDRSTIEDTEMFGWSLKEIDSKVIKTPYRESIVVSEIATDLDDPTQSTIIVQNYRTQFEDLFQKIAAETQSLQYKEGSYDSAASAVDANGQILPGAVANTFNDSSFVIANAADQGLSWDDRGITATDQTNKSLVVNIKGGVVRVSSDGGATWSNSITGSGIDANTITTGVLNTNLVNIRNGDTEAFKWTKDGIVATLYDDGIYDFSSKITLNQYGIYGGLKDGFELSSNFNERLNEIHQTARFALTWKGFSLKTGHHNSTGYVAIDSDDDFTVNVKKNANDTVYQKIIQIGHLESDESTSNSDASNETSETNSDASTTQHYGIRIKDLLGNVIFTTTEEGKIDGRFHINCGSW